MKSVALMSLLLFVATTGAAKELLPCKTRGSIDYENDWHLVPAKKAAFANAASKRFTGFDPKYGIDAIVAFASTPKSEDEVTLDFVAGVEVHRGDAVARFQILGDQGVPRLRDEYQFRNEEPPRPKISLAVDASVPIVRIDYNRYAMGAHGESDIDYAVLIDVRGETPRLATVGCEGGWVGGACTAHDSAYGVRTYVRCDWSAERDDYACETRRELETDRGLLRAIGRSELLSKTPLPASEPRQQIFTDGTLRFSAMPSSTHIMSMRLFAEHSGGRVEEVPVERLMLAPTTRSDDVAKQDFTLVPPKHAFSARLLQRIGSAKIYSVLLTEGERRALFWVGIDGLGVRALRVASTAAEYDRCGVFRRPASITSATWTGDAAEVVIESAFVSSSSRPPVDDENEHCAVTATVRWSREHGFVVAPRADCMRPALQVEIGPNGELRTAPRKVR